MSVGWPMGFHTTVEKPILNHYFLRVDMLPLTLSENDRATWRYSPHFVYFHFVPWPSRLEQQNTPTAFLQRGKTTLTGVLNMTVNKASVMLELWGMWSTPSLQSLPGPRWSGRGCS